MDVDDEVSIFPDKDMVWKASRTWGLDVVYAEVIPTSETFAVKLAAHTNEEIRLFTLNGQWGFSMDIDGGNEGWGYLSFLKFCEPYPTREDALRGAVRYIEESFARAHVKDSHSKAVLAWAQSLCQASMQLKLF